MTHEELKPWLDAFVDGELDLARRLEAERHLNGCSACSALVDSRRSLREAVRGASLRFDPPAGFQRRLNIAVREAEGGAAPVLPWVWNGWPAGFAAGAALAT